MQRMASLREEKLALKVLYVVKLSKALFTKFGLSQVQLFLTREC